MTALYNFQVDVPSLSADLAMDSHISFCLANAFRV